MILAKQSKTQNHLKKMKTMKNLQLTKTNTGIPLILSMVLLLLGGCNGDDDTVPDTSALFAGNYSVKDVSDYSGHVYNYDVTITKTGTGEVTISNFADIFNVPVKATVNGMSFTIAPQTFTNPSSKQITVSGSGSLQNDVLTFTYSTLGYLDYSGKCEAVKNN